MKSLPYTFEIRVPDLNDVLGPFALEDEVPLASSQAGHVDELRAVHIVVVCPHKFSELTDQSQSTQEDGTDRPCD